MKNGASKDTIKRVKKLIEKEKIYFLPANQI